MTHPRSLHVLTETRNPETGQLDAELIARVLGLTLRELGQLLQQDPQDLSKNPSNERLQSALQPLDELAFELREVFSSLDIARRWLRAWGAPQKLDGVK